MIYYSDVIKLFKRPDVSFEQKMLDLRQLDRQISAGEPSDMKPVEQLEPHDIYNLRV